MLSEKLKRRFCKDFNIKIDVFEEPYFIQRLQLFGFEKEYQEFEKLIKEKFLDDEGAFLDYYDKVKDEMISYIQKSETYNQMNSDKTLLNNSFENIPHGDIYKENYLYDNYISIDMKKANFNALVSYGIIHGTNFNDGNYSYDSFVKKFTDIDYFVKSKNIRQVVFGNCNSKRIQKIEKDLMYALVKYLKMTFYDINEQIIRVNNDEIIIKPNKNMLKKLTLLQEKIEDYSKDYVPFTFSYFRLGRAFGTKVFIKQDIKHGEYCGTFELKCKNAMETLFVTKRMKDIPITEDDKIFKSEHGLAKILNVPEIEIHMSQKNDTSKNDVSKLTEMELEEDEIFL